MIDDLLAELSFVPLVKRPLNDIPAMVVIGGMGGSGYAGEVLAYLLAHRNISVHRDYGIPPHAGPEALYIAVSYSGTTEETLSFANAVREKGYRLAVVAAGGALADFAEREGLTSSLVPHGLQPRYALAYMVHALLAIIGETTVADELRMLSLDPAALGEKADMLAHDLLPSVPLFYASRRNAVLASLGKIMMNETAHTPAFTNVFSELNHNEMQAFDSDMPEGLAHTFRFVVIRDETDGARIARRMDAFTDVMLARGRTSYPLVISGMTPAEAFVTLWIVFVRAAELLAETRGIDTSTVPLIEDFKKRI